MRLMDVSVSKMAAMACAALGLACSGSASAGGPAGHIVLDVTITSLDGQAIAPITFDQTWTLLGQWTGSVGSAIPGVDEARGLQFAAPDPSPVSDALLASVGMSFLHGEGAAKYDSGDAFGTEVQDAVLSTAFGSNYADGNSHYEYSMIVQTPRLPIYDPNYTFLNFLSLIETQPLSFTEELETCNDAVLATCGVGATTYSGTAQFVSYVPEPRSWLLMGLGLGALGAIMRRHGLQRRKSHRANHLSALA